MSENPELTASLPVDLLLDHSSLLAEVLATTNLRTPAGQLRKPHPLIAHCPPARPPARPAPRKMGAPSNSFAFANLNRVTRCEMRPLRPYCSYTLIMFNPSPGRMDDGCHPGVL